MSKRKEVRYIITYKDGTDIITRTVRKDALNNFLIGLDCCGCKIIEVVKA